MTYVLTFCENLNIFGLGCPDLSHRTFTEGELRQEWDGNATLIRYLEFAKANPNKDCYYDMLPRYDMPLV